MRAVVAVLTVLVVVLYPVAIWIGLAHLSPRAVGLWLLVALVPGVVLRFRKAKGEDVRAVLRVPLAIVSVVLLGVVLDDPRFVLAMPVLVSLLLLATFASSLRADHTIIERFARMQNEKPLTAGQIAHCRQATWGWCAFFLVNAAIAATLALAAPVSWWAAYSGGIAYGLMGAVYGVEYIVRRARFRMYGGGLFDRILARLFPPREAAQ